MALIQRANPIQFAPRSQQTDWGVAAKGLGDLLGTLGGQKLQAFKEQHEETARKEKRRKYGEALGLTPEENKRFIELPEGEDRHFVEEIERTRKKHTSNYFGEPKEATGLEALRQEGEKKTLQEEEQGAITDENAEEGAKIQELQNKVQDIKAQDTQPDLIKPALSLEERKLASKERSEAFKETKEERKAIYQKTQAAKRSLRELDHFEELEEEGKLDTPGYLEFLKRSGFDIANLKDPSSQEFEKIAAGFIKGARDIFGSRISNFELESFLKTIPNLSQSPEGRKRVIAGLKQIARADVEYNNAYKEIMNENGGVPPLDLLERIDDRIDSKLDKIADMFREDLKKPVPKGQNKLITALQAGAGDVVGNAGRLAKGAAGAYAGAKLGKIAGPYGAVGGGIIGGLGGLSGLV